MIVTGGPDDETLTGTPDDDVIHGGGGAIPFASLANTPTLSASGFVIV